MAQTVASDIVLPDDAVRFCAAHDLSGALQTALSIARETFAPVRGLTVEFEIDPETGDETIVVQVSAKLSVEEVLRRKRDYTTRWIQSAPAEARERIRLLFDIS